MTPGSLLLNSFRNSDVSNRNECSFDDFCKCIDSVVPWPDVKELWELWQGFFDCFCMEHSVQSAACGSLRYLLFIVHHCGQDGLTIADVTGISHETRMQLNALGSGGVAAAATSTARSTGSDAPSSPAVGSCSEALPAVPHLVAEGLRSITAALLSSSFVAAFDRCRSIAAVQQSRAIMSSAWFLQAIADQHLKGEGSVCVLLLTLLLSETDVHRSGTVTFEQLCQFMRAFQVTLTLKDQKSQVLVQYFSSAQAGAGGFGKEPHATTPIHYRRFLAHLRGALPVLRQQKLQQLFNVLDHSNKGFLSVDDLSSSLPFSMVSADAIRNLGYAAAMSECSATLMSLITAASAGVQREHSMQQSPSASVSIAAFIEFYHALSCSISRNPVFFALLYRTWERGLENPGDLLDTSNINFRRSKVFGLAALATRSDPQTAADALAPQASSRWQHSHTSTPALKADCDPAESPSKMHSNQGASPAATPDGFVFRLQSPKFMDESNFHSRRATPRGAAFDGAAGVTSASGTNTRIYSHLNRGSNHLPVQYDPEIDGFTTIRRKLVGSSGDHAASSARDELNGAVELSEHGSRACAGVFARVRGLLHQERATSKYKDSHQGHMNPMKFVSRWNNFIWIAVNVVLEDARSTAASSAAAQPRCMQGTVSVAGFSQAMEDTLCAHLVDAELALLAREYHSGQSGSLAYAPILLALISSNNAARDSRKLLMWQALETASGFRGRLPLANVFRTMNVAGHPLVANRMCDASEFFSRFFVRALALTSRY